MNIEDMDNLSNLPDIDFNNLQTGNLPDDLDYLRPQPIDSTGKVSVSPDRMRVFIKMTMPQNDGRHLLLSEIRALIDNAKVTHGLRELTISRLAEAPLFDRDVLVAEGTPPVKGKDGSLVYHVRLSKDAVPHEREDGSVDYKDLGLIENVEKDQLLVDKIMPEPGIEGKTVFSEPVKAQAGKEFPLPVGKNTYVSENGLALHASINGQCDYSDRKLNVLETFTVNGDVSTSTGSINFIGNVLVNGNVLAGYTVQAGGNIEIQGCVEGGNIVAGGNVLIRDGFHGMYKGEIIAGGSVRSKYIQAGRVQAGGLIESQVVMQANVQTGDTVKLVGNRSVIMGGRVAAKKLVDCFHIGGKNNPIPTVVEVGSDPQLVSRSHEIQKEEAIFVKSIADVDRILVLLKQLEAQNRLTPDKREMLIRSVQTRRNTSERLIALKAEAEEVRLKLAEEGYGTILARIAMYPGVRVIIGPEQQIISKQIENCRITRGEDGLTFSAAV